MSFIVSLCLLLFVTVNCVYSENDSYKTVETHSGGVRGMQKSTFFRNISYHAFLGVPYAEKPIGDLRFKAPIPIAAWKPNILDTFQYQNSCIQQSFAIGNSGPESEDCLYLNIFVPANFKSSKKLPVIFYIHGGGFSEGSGNNFFFGPDFLLEKGVIVVTINYRLGAFGFMSLNTKQHSGNMGLKDQYTALKWIHHNINAFGGNKHRITLMGQSAGAVSANYHLLFHQSRRLINGVICMSGTAFLRYAYLDEKSHWKKMLEFGQKFNKSIQHTHELVNFLEHVSVHDIVNLTSQTSFDKTLVFDWAPVIERKSAIRPILLRTPEEMYKSNRRGLGVNTMFGYTNYECLSLAWADASNSTRLNDFIDKCDFALPVHRLNPQHKSKSYRRLTKKVCDYYFDNVTTENDKAVQFVNMISDLNMVVPIDRAVKTQAANTKSSIFYYQFAIDGELNYIKRTLNIKWPGASHCDDLCYVFRCNSIDSVYDDIKKKMDHDENSKLNYDAIQHMSGMFANFAKYGHTHYNLSRQFTGHRKRIQFLNITNKGISPGLSPKKDSIRFWNRILQKAQTLVR